jgi:spermidine synthase
VADSMRQIGFNSATDMFATYAGQESDLHTWLQGAQINTDRNLRLMYLAGWGFNSDLEDPLYKEIIGFRQPPLNLFTGSDQNVQMLYQKMHQDAQ